MDIEDIEDITDDITNMSFDDKYNHELLDFIDTLKISENIKGYLKKLIENDNFNDYSEIYNVCIENGIELPVPYN
jgi:hypothetical protein